MKLLDTIFLVHYWRGDEVADFLQTHKEGVVLTTPNTREISI